MSTKTTEEKKFSCDQLFDPAGKIPGFDMGDSIRKALHFREDLIVKLKNKGSSDTKPIGGYCISVENIGTNGNEFMIQVLSSLTVDNSFAGSKLIASSTARFHCLEEKRTEFMDRCDGLYEKTLYLGLEEDVYHIEVEDSCPCDKSAAKIDLPLCSNGEIISEGVNLLLMRYLALKNFHGSLSFLGLTIRGQLTTSNYRCSEMQKMKFNGYEVEIYIVERKIHEECGLVHNSKTLLTKNGRILKHDWLELPYLLKINSLLDPNETGNQERRVHPPLRLRWNSDVQLMSMYLDKKTCQMAQQTEYLVDHPEVKQLISDFTQSLLAVKPVNVLLYAIQHFAAFAKNPEIGGSDESNLGPIPSQLSKQKLQRVCSVCGICFEHSMSAQHSSNAECGRAVASLITPVASRCSVFTKCPSNVSCNLHSHRKMNSPASSLCSVFTKCPSDVSCVKKSHGGNRLHDQRLKTQSSKILSSCSVFSKCPSDSSCVKKLSSCSEAVVNCSKNCEGCKSDENRHRVCSLHPACEETCEGCRDSGTEACLVLKDCPDCPGCQESCDEARVCPDCPGCQEFCDKARVCPDCRGCGGVEITTRTSNHVEK